MKSWMVAEPWLLATWKKTRARSWTPRKPRRACVRLTPGRVSATVHRNSYHLKIDIYKFVKKVPDLRRTSGGRKLQSTNLDVQFSELDRGSEIVRSEIVAPYYLVQTWRLSNDMSMMVWIFPI